MDVYGRDIYGQWGYEQTCWGYPPPCYGMPLYARPRKDSGLGRVYQETVTAGTWWPGQGSLAQAVRSSDFFSLK